MQDWQEQYLRNVQETAQIRPLFGKEHQDFETWYREHLAAEERLRVLKAENTALLSSHLFPALDTLLSADDAVIAELDAFADRLMDWRTNLDCGVYAAIHDALLSMYRIRKDRNAIIRELYKLGMGLYYLHRSVTGVDCRESESMRFRNEMVFTEAGSYFRYFEAINDEETRGYILRAMANVSICTLNYKRKINTTIKTIRIVKSPEYRAIAPGLPWDTYLQRANMQLSSCRTQLSSGEITHAEIAAVMDACYEVFKPETQSATPSRRWLWPYYDMQYQCGYVSIETTADRLERLIMETDPEEYDLNGIYGNIQLPIFYGRILKTHEKLLADKDRRAALDAAYRKMLDAFMNIPPELCDENFTYSIIMVISDFFEIEGSVSYRDLSTRLMQRFAGRLYLQSLKAGELMECFCAHILEQDPDYFNGLPLPDGISALKDRRKHLLQYAADCGLYHNFGLFKMNLERTMLTRTLFENEDAMYKLHTISGYDDLRRRKSTEQFADIARGHHSSYSNSIDAPSGYVRMESPYRRMTDLMALISDLMDSEGENIREWRKAVRSERKSRFSPLAAAFLSDELLASLDEILRSDDKERCRKAFNYFYKLSE